MARPRLTPEELEARVADYCQRYGVAPNDAGLPPFPMGRRETRQHRDWMAVYKAHNRLGRRRRGQCERCSAPVSDGSVFCEDHRADVSAGADKDGASRAALAAQDGRCPVCGQKLTLPASVQHGDSLLHQRCHRLVALAESLGPAGVDGLRSYLWPERPLRPGSRR
jgi:hypothetical protein